MLWIVRTSPGYLALADSDAPPVGENDTGRLVLLRGQGVCALPDAAFWALLKAPQPHHSPSIYAEMIAENPARMARVWPDGYGVGEPVIGRLRQEKTILSQSELTRANAHTKAPKPGTFEED